MLGEFWIVWVVPSRTVDRFDGDLYVGGSKKCRGLWNVAALANTWALWLERDNRIFEDVEGVSNFGKELSTG